VLDLNSIPQRSQETASIKDRIAARGQLTARPALGLLDLRQQFLAMPHPPGQGLLRIPATGPPPA
jgi:hypothetical protein